MSCIMLINSIMPAIVGIPTNVNIIITTSESLTARMVLICQHFSFYEQLKIHAQLSLLNFSITSQTIGIFLFFMSKLATVYDMSQH